MENRRALLVLSLTFAIAIAAGTILVAFMDRGPHAARAGTTAGQDAAPAGPAADLPPAR